jgi:maltose alpha-D-glucosyltransferase/alpha-amylase
MQWSNDRNGGFSRADFARLVAPPIMDPLYGFQAVNVEAQSLDAHSLLNWTKRMIAVRQSHATTFGRGDYVFLYPGNRKVLAYVRENDGEAILCVANLSRSPQAVELDLAAWHGRVPVELLGRTPFPPIGDLPYLLTLPPFGFMWFVLAEEHALPNWHAPAPVAMPELVTFVLREGLHTAFGEQDRATFEKQVLPAYLPLRRWYQGKGSRLTEARLAATAVIKTAEGDMVLTGIETVRGSTDRYFIPIAVVFEDQERMAPLSTQLALARARRGRRVGLVTDAASRDAFVRAMVANLAAGSTLPSSKGEIRFRPAARLADVVPDAEAPIARFGGEQSNTTIMIGETVLKLVRHTFVGIHPEAEMCRYLTGPGGFDGTPAFLGDVVHVGEDGTERTLAVAQAFVRNQGDAWSWTLGQLKRLLDDVLLHEGTSEDGETPEAGEGVLGSLELFLATLGRRIGEMHLALARETDDADFSPQPLTAETIAAWRDSARGEAEAALDLLARQLGDLPAEAQEAAAALLAARVKVLAMIEESVVATPGGLCTRIHGDLHLGQVLVAAGDAVIVDFEGEPLRPLAERRARSTPARDVAGMLRSLDYAAAAALRDLTPRSPGAADPRPDLVDRWGRQARAVFLAAYHETVAGSPAWPVDEAACDGLTALFVAGKAAYELTYELKNRPAWAIIPIRALLALAGVEPVTDEEA